MVTTKTVGTPSDTPDYEIISTRGQASSILINGVREIKLEEAVLVKVVVDWTKREESLGWVAEHKPRILEALMENEKILGSDLWFAVLLVYDNNIAEIKRAVESHNSKVQNACIRGLHKHEFPRVVLTADTRVYVEQITRGSGEELDRSGVPVSLRIERVQITDRPMATAC